MVEIGWILVGLRPEDVHFTWSGGGTEMVSVVVNQPNFRAFTIEYNDITFYYNYQYTPLGWTAGGPQNTQVPYLGISYLSSVQMSVKALIQRACFT